MLAWSSVYPTDSDDAILHFDGRAALSMQEIDTILHWKLETQANYLAVARRNLASQPPEFVLDHVARAVRNPDDQAAFLLLANIKGFQIAIASSILMAPPFWKRFCVLVASCSIPIWCSLNDWDWGQSEQTAIGFKIEDNGRSDRSDERQ